MKPIDTHPIWQINLIVRDMERTLDFYRRLGWEIEAPIPQHAVCHLSPDLSVAFDAEEFVATWDGGYRGGSGGTTVLTVSSESRDGVDSLYGELVDAGYFGRQAPYDAFWGGRFAIVEDPDGNPVGIMSSTDRALASSPAGFSPPTA